MLSDYGRVIRIGIDPHDTNDSEPIAADAHIKDEEEEKDWDLPISESVTFDLGVFHPVCSKWAFTTSISGDPEEHTNMIPSARSIAERYCNYYVIENVPQAPLNNPTVLDGPMFGLPIEYKRAFETNFRVPQPPQHNRFWGEDGQEDTAETSSFFFTERSRRWWGSVKGVPGRAYPKQHLAKNVIPGAYIHHICRAWLREFEDDADIDYSDYDERMEKQRRKATNRSLSEFDSKRETDEVSDGDESGFQKFVPSQEG